MEAQKNGHPVDKKSDRPHKVEVAKSIGPRETIHLKIDEIKVEDGKNVRQKTSYDAGSDTFGSEVPSLEALGQSMRDKGQLQPCGVVRTDKGYCLVYGFRRYHAAKAAGLETLWCAIFPSDEPAEILAVQLLENKGRKDLNAYETGRGIAKLLEGGYKPSEAARATTLSKQSVSNYKLIFEKVAPIILDAWKKNPGTLTVGWLLERTGEEHPIQLEKFRGLSEGQKPSTAPTSDKDDGKGEGGEPKRKMAKRHDVEMVLGFAREQRFDSRGPDFVVGMVAALEYVIGEGDMPPPDAPRPNEAAGDLGKSKK